MIRRQLSAFLIVGSLTALIDFLSYRSIVWTELLGVDTAKGVGFILGTGFAYFANRAWTFGFNKHLAGSLWRFVALYTITLTANVVLNMLVLEILATTPGAVELAFLFATVVSATLNFIGMRSFVFKVRGPLKPL